MKALFLIFITIGFMANSQENIYDFEFQTIEGKTQKMSAFKGKKILIINTASECGYTPQYEALQKVHEAYGDKVVLIGFPANNFGGQEPGSNDEIAQFCKKNYGVTFLMAAKVSVTGSDIHPIFKWLCDQENEAYKGSINWNFEKFLINEKGKLIMRYRSGTQPNDPDITNRF